MNTLLLAEEDAGVHSSRLTTANSFGNNDLLLTVAELFDINVCRDLHHTVRQLTSVCVLYDMN